MRIEEVEKQEEVDVVKELDKAMSLINRSR